jgi:hypothetical protein
VRLLRLGFGKRLGPRVDCPPPLAEPYIGAPILLFTCLNYDSGVEFVGHWKVVLMIGRGFDVKALDVHVLTALRR